MARRRNHAFHRPFAGLKTRLENAVSRVGAAPITDASIRVDDTRTAAAEPGTEREEQEFFHHAVRDVTPAHWRSMAPYHTTAPRPDAGTDGTDDVVLNQLTRLIEAGDGFTINQTAEYMEVRQSWVPPDLPRRLHRGDFSIQAHIDLHGHGVRSAKEAVDAFLSECVRDGMRAVLIVHGRGLSSPGEPILKYRVYRWLTHGQWRKRVMAFTSAPRHDGGTGGTYILLHPRPIPKKLRNFTSVTGH